MSAPLPADLGPVLKQLARCIVGFGPYQRDAVLCGGLVPVLYRRALICEASHLVPLTTFDLDWVLPRELPRRGDLLHDLVLKAGFTAQLSGSSRFPVTHYLPNDAGGSRPQPIYVEFLAPRLAGQRGRRGNPQGIFEVQPGLHAQTDPYLGLLLRDNLIVDATQVPEFELTGSHEFVLPHPICFILQKTLIRNKRSPGKQGNDLSHIYDVAMLTHGMWPAMRDVLEKLKSERKFPPTWFNRAGAALSKLFAAPTSAGSVAVARNYAAVSEEETVRGMKAFLNACWPYLKKND